MMKQPHKRALLHDFLVTSWQDKESRGILMFLVLNASFMSLEFVYGYLSNSLSLIGDSFHMLCDSMALVIGLGASYVSKRGLLDRTWKLPHGYMRVESLSALMNSLFLMQVSSSLMLKGIDRLYHPQKINVEEYDT
jgi:zinc transporter 5/7